MSQRADKPLVVVMRYMPDGPGLFSSRLGGVWQFVTQGTGPALSPDGKQLVFTKTMETAGGESARRIRVIDLGTGQVSRPVDVPLASEQYGAGWAPSGRFLFFHVYYPGEKQWTVGRLSFPSLEYSRVGELPPDVIAGSISPDGRFTIANDIVSEYPGFGVDGPWGLYLVERATGKRTVFTPPGFLAGETTCWLKATNEILLVGIWHPENRRSVWHVYRVNPFTRSWATASRREWEQRRLTEGQEISCAQ